jgi:hypothetical protein
VAPDPASCPPDSRLNVNGTKCLCDPEGVFTVSADNRRCGIYEKVIFIC